MAVRTLAAVAAAALLSAGPAGADERSELLLLPIRLLDTSAEPSDQNADHMRRLADFQAALARSLSSAYRISTLTETSLGAACPTSDGSCIVDMGRRRGADVALIAVVHKSSNLIMQLFVRMVDLSDNRVTASRELSFRGDNDESWRRAEVFLADQLLRASPR